MIGPFKAEYRWLSNFWAAPVLLDGCRYPTVEHAYQAAKTASAAERRKIRGLSTAGDAKRAGAALPLPGDWEERKEAVMLDLLRQKFADPNLAELLIATDSESLVEINSWGDTFWGVCDGNGQNRLGRLLEQVRDEVKETNRNPRCEVDSSCTILAHEHEPEGRS